MDKNWIGGLRRRGSEQLIAKPTSIKDTGGKSRRRAWKAIELTSADLLHVTESAGILGLTHSCAALFAREGITANPIAPGLIDTDMAASVPKQVRDEVPPETVGSAEEVARIAVLLAETKPSPAKPITSTPAGT
jgi:Enoyl-(Acyl carrier protein) reductase